MTGAGRDVPAWKVAEMRLRARDPEPWRKWRGWNYNETDRIFGPDGMLAGDSDDQSSGEAEEERRARRYRSAFEVERRRSMTREEWLNDRTSLRKVGGARWHSRAVATKRAPSLCCSCKRGTLIPPAPRSTTARGTSTFRA